MRNVSRTDLVPYTPDSPLCRKPVADKSQKVVKMEGTETGSPGLLYQGGKMPVLRLEVVSLEPVVGVLSGPDSTLE